MKRIAMRTALALVASAATAHEIENHLYEHPQSPAALECVESEPVSPRADGTYRQWDFTNACAQVITVVTCLHGETCNWAEEEYGREAVREFRYYFDVHVVEPGDRSWITLRCGDGYCPPSDVRYAACFGDVVREYHAAVAEDGLIAALPNGDFACMLHDVEDKPPPPTQGGGRGE